MPLVALIAAVILLAGSAVAQQPEGFSWKQSDGSPAPPDPSRASRNGFGVMMLVTADYDGFLKAWEGATPPQITTTERVDRNKPIHGMLIFSGCRAAPNGNCDVVATLSIFGPDGKLYNKVMTGPVWRRPPPPGYNLEWSESNVGFRLEPQDRLGIYTLKALVTDNVAGNTLTVQQAVTATGQVGSQ